jgi:hypothetical protein
MLAPASLLTRYSGTRQRHAAAARGSGTRWRHDVMLSIALVAARLGGRPRRSRRHGLRRHGLRRHGPRRFVSRSSGLRSSRTSSCLSPVSPACASTVSGGAGREAPCHAHCDHAHSAMHFAPRLVASAATVPFDARGGSPLSALHPHPFDLQAEGRVRGCRQECRRNDTLFEQRQKVWQEGSGAQWQGANPRNTADQRAQRAVTPLAARVGHEKDLVGPAFYLLNCAQFLFSQAGGDNVRKDHAYCSSERHEA